MSSSKFLRSFLFVPAASEKLLASAVSRPADSIILDLEDGTHPSLKTAARQSLRASIQRISAAEKSTAVRINGDWLSAYADLTAAVIPGLDIVVLPKVEHARDIQILDAIVTDLETQSGIPPGTVRFLLQIESTKALSLLNEIATASPRTMGMMLGSEDFSLDCGATPSPDSLIVPSLMVLYAARAAGIQPIGFVASIANLDNVDEFQGILERARSLGFRGAVVVHPKFIDAVNICFTASNDELARAQKIVQAFEAAFESGLGAIKVDGVMVDKPVYRRAQDLLRERGKSEVSTAA